MKEVLKRVFPRLLLKRAFEFVNALRIATLDRILFPEYEIVRSSFKVYRKGYPFLENEVDISDLHNPMVRSFMDKWTQWSQEEFILSLDVPCVIEPDYGWALIPPAQLIYFSLGISRTRFQRKPRFFKLINRKNVQAVERAISLRDTGEENYFHFYNDVLAKVWFLSKNDIDVQQIPVIVSSKLWSTGHFQYMLKHIPKLKSIQWIVQDTQYLSCNKVIFCKPLTHRLDIWSALFETLHRPRSQERKLLVLRKRDTLRYIENQDDIVALCGRFGIEPIEPSDLSVEQQIECFTNASLIIGIHGSGLVNLFFANKPCLVLEIFPPPEFGYIPFHYIMLAKMKGFSYAALVGKKAGQWSGGIFVDPTILEDELLRLGFKAQQKIAP